MNQLKLKHAQNSLARTKLAVHAGVQIVRKIIAADVYPEGLTSHELYKLALKEPPPPDFQHHLPPPRPPTNQKPPHPEHPIKSMKFLKESVLPVLAGNQEIRMKPVKRIPSQPIVKGKKSVSAAVPSPVNVWAWTKVDKSPLPKPPASSPKPRFGSEVGLGEDWGHLSRRRQSSRQEKVRRDVRVMKDILARTVRS